MQDAKVEIKGVRDGLLIIIEQDAEWQSAIAELTERIDKQPGFFSGSKITVNLGQRPVPKFALGSLKAAMDRRGLALALVLSDSPTTQDAADALDMRVGPSTIPAESAEEMAVGFHTQPFDPDEDVRSGVLVPRTLRGGRRVHSNGHVVVMGDVNPGAEIVAGGDVIVWGVLRGVVHAGATGDLRSRICALEMDPTQLRIADRYSVTPKEKGLFRRKVRPEMARVDGDYIIVEPWLRTPRKE
jgi:septum site-determining protein MinC